MPALLRKYRRILGFAQTEWRSLACAVAVSVLFAGLAAVQPWPLKLLIDYAVGDAVLPVWMQTAFGSAGHAPDRTRPLCAYPRVAKYKGTGSIDDASNFVCMKQ